MRKEEKEGMRATDIIMILIGLGVLWSSGCAARASVQTTPAPAPQAAEESAAYIESPYDIAALQAEIEEQRGIIAGLTQCIDRCRAADSICESADRICTIASDLAEREAIESCRRAESSCYEAQDSIDDCDCT